MPLRGCVVCKRLQNIPTKDWNLASFSGDFVCSKECAVGWLDSHLNQRIVSDPYRFAATRAVELWTNRDDQPVFRSRYEERLTVFLDSSGILWDYERFGFFVGDKKTYMPDFFLPQYQVFLEAKGRWGAGQKKKMAMFRGQYPEVPLLVIHWLLNEEFGNGSG